MSGGWRKCTSSIILVTQINKRSEKMKIEQNKNLKSFNSWKVGGEAEFFCQACGLNDLLECLKWANQRGVKVSFLGSGTNVLISDKGVKGLVINCNKLKGLQHSESEGRLYIRAFSGTLKSEVMQVFVRYQLAPALFLCGLPGQVGGGVVMNAGWGQKKIPPTAGGEASDVPYTKASLAAEESQSVPREFKDIVDEISVVRPPGQTEKIKKNQIHWEYRKSKGWEPGIIFEVKMSWPLKPLPGFKERLKALAMRRALSQPLRSASCGSVFKNPKKGLGAGALIEKCGLKGFEVGGAEVSKKHANFILNTGAAQAEEIHRLIQRVQKKVKDQLGVWLEPEVRYLGQWPHLE